MSTAEEQTVEELEWRSYVAASESFSMLCAAVLCWPNAFLGFLGLIAKTVAQLISTYCHTTLFDYQNQGSHSVGKLLKMSHWNFYFLIGITQNSIWILAPKFGQMPLVGFNVHLVKMRLFCSDFQTNVRCKIYLLDLFKFRKCFHADTSCTILLAQQLLLLLIWTTLDRPPISEMPRIIVF